MSGLNPSQRSRDHDNSHTPTGTTSTAHSPSTPEVMEALDGYLLVPPERGAILGRAMWKPRYVIVRRRHVYGNDETGAVSTTSASSSFSQKMTPSRIQSQSSKKKTNVTAGEYFIAIYKAKEDAEPSHQYPVSSVTDCQVQQVAHRKQGPVLPTLVISICDKEKKRRSSRAAGLISSKDQTSTMLWFRTPPDDHHHSLHEWKHFILSRKWPMSPESPASPTFINPFGNGRPGPNSAQQRPGSRSRNQRPNLAQTTPSHSYSSRDYERPGQYNSESPSLRSKRSDISSPSSAVMASYPGLPIQGQHYTTVLPTDIPADANARGGAPVGSGNAPGAQGWVNAYGMTPSDSDAAPDSSSPPGPRETILDRAFQLRCIPGSDRMIPGEEKLSSLARFDALMREADGKRIERGGQTPVSSLHHASRQSAWDDDSDGNEEDEDALDEDDEDSNDEDNAHSSDDGENRSQRRHTRDTIIPPSAQRALEFIAGRHEESQAQQAPPRRRERPAARKSELEIDVDSFPMPVASPPPFRPHTSYTKRRPNMSTRTPSQPQLVPSAPASAALGGSLNLSTDVVSDPPAQQQQQQQQYYSSSSRLGGEEMTVKEKRMSNSSIKRLSFTEFTKRLSSTSSLLIAQTTTAGSGGASSRGSSEWDPTSPVPRSSLSPRGVPPNLKWRGDGPAGDESDKRCGGWRRSSVGVFGGDGSMI